MTWFPSRVHNGFITLLAVVILTVVSVAIVISILTTGISSGKISQGVEIQTSADWYANACTEKALGTLRNLGIGTEIDDSFNDSLTIDSFPDLGIIQGSCTVDVVDEGGETRSIFATGYAGSNQEVISRVRVIVTAISPRIIVYSWEEVDGF